MAFIQNFSLTRVYRYVLKKPKEKMSNEKKTKRKPRKINIERTKIEGKKSNRKNVESMRK